MIEFVDKVSVSLVDCLASDDMVAMAAWVSNDMDNEERLNDRDKVKGLINFLYRNRHMSPFEHGVFIFKVDVPIFVAREWHRHRTMSYNEVSGRYTEMNPRFYVAPKNRPLVQQGKMGDYQFVPGSDDQYALVRANQERVIGQIWTAYQNQLQAGVAKEVARDILPVSLMTQFYVTVNPRNLMQFLSLRNDVHALYEIREAARQMDDIFKSQMPLTHKAFKRHRIEMVDQDSTPPLSEGTILPETVTVDADKINASGISSEKVINVVYNLHDSYGPNPNDIAEVVRRRMSEQQRMRK